MEIEFYIRSWKEVSMDENEFTPINSAKSKSKQNSNSKKKSTIFKLAWIENLKGYDFSKILKSFGVGLILFSVFLFFAIVSYIFTWKYDQDKVIHKGFFEFIFNSEQLEIKNWLGKFGAWVGHFYVHNLFGIASIALSFLSFLIGVRIAFKKSFLPLWKSINYTLLYMLWTSMFLGFFSNRVSYLGGKFGFYLNDWSVITFGTIATFCILCALFYLLFTFTVNPNYSRVISSFKSTLGLEKNTSTHVTEDGTIAIDESDENEHIVINPIKREDIESDNVSTPIHFNDSSQDEDKDVTNDNPKDKSTFNLEETSNLEMETSSNSEEESNSEDFEIEMAKEEEQHIDAHGDEIEAKANALVEEFGEYDPTLDLEGFLLPSIDLLKDYGSSTVSVNKEELESNKDKIVETLGNYKIDIAKIKATVGPTVTLYEIIPAPGVRISKIKNLEDDIALSLSALGIRIIAPIPGKGTIGIEVPNSNPEMVSMRSLIASEKFQNFDGELPVVMGKTITNETYVFDLTKMPHLLVAGATGQGKSVGLNAILISILYKKHPAQVKFVLVDPKKVELTLYNKIERHFLAKLPGEEDAIITDTSKVVNTLNSLCIEMDDRYELLKDAQVRTIKEYNAKFISRKLNPENGHRYMPYIVVLIDEFADLIMTAGKEVEHPIARIAQLARAIGIHLIVATQRPSVNVITGMIKANFPARIAFRVLSKIDSRTILDASGADQLIGRGDMLISTGSDMKRLQCGFVDTPEVDDICSYIGDQRAYPEALLLPEYVPEGGEGPDGFDMDEMDVMFVEAARTVVINNQGSASLLQRKLKLGYNRAGRIVDQLEAMNIIGPFQGSKAREVLFSDTESLDEFLRAKGLL